MNQHITTTSKERMAPEIPKWRTLTASMRLMVSIAQGRLNLLKVVGAHLTNKTNFYGKKLNSYEQLIKVVGARAPSAPLVPPPMV